MKNGFFIFLAVCTSVFTPNFSAACTEAEKNILTDVEYEIYRREGQKAMELLEKVSSSCQNEPGTKVLFAKTFATLGGVYYDEVSYAFDYGSSDNFFNRAFKAVYDRPVASRVRDAISKIEEISKDSNKRTNEENETVAILAAGYAGALAWGSDTNGDGMLNDNLDFCSGEIVPDSIVNELLVSQGLIVVNSNSIQNSANDLINFAFDTKIFCDQFDKHLCTVTKSEDITAEDNLWMRRILASQKTGIGACVDDPQNCCK